MVVHERMEAGSRHCDRVDSYRQRLEIIRATVIRSCRDSTRKRVARDGDIRVRNRETARIGDLPAHTSPRRLRDTRQDGKEAENRKAPHEDVREMVPNLLAAGTKGLFPNS